MFLCALLATALATAAAREVRHTSPRARKGSFRVSEADASLRGSYNPPEFFDAFSVGESTWDWDGEHTERSEDNPYHMSASGSTPQMSEPFDPKEVAPAWFEESQSAGSAQALQTNWPQVPKGPASHGIASGKWYQNDAGVWIQAYKYPEKWAESTEGAAQSTGNIVDMFNAPGTKPAAWFDASVNQYDAYGRPKVAYPGNPANMMLLGYTQKAVNTSVACEQAGCTATAMLNVAEADEDIKYCQLSVLVKPTDFGEGKVVEFISVNDVNVSIGCTPTSAALAAGSCSSEEASSLSQLFACVESIPVEHLLSDDGSLKIGAKISNGVNSSECAYEGNMLYAIPQVTCMVATPPPPGNVSNIDSRPIGTPIAFSHLQQAEDSSSMDESNASSNISNDTAPAVLSNLQQAEALHKQDKDARLRVKRH